jgi:hypothetical protein
MLSQTNASYITKNTNSKGSVQRAMLVSTNGMMTMRRLKIIPAKICKDGRGRTPLLIKTCKGLKRETFMPL